MSMPITNPFNLSNWLAGDTGGGNDSNHDIQLCNANEITNPADHNKATRVKNIVPENMAFAAINTAPGHGVFGLFGESGGSTTSAGVLGSSACWGVVGASVSQNIDPDELDTTTRTGVLGLGDRFGVCGRITPLSEKQASDQQDPDLSGVTGVGVLGVGHHSGVHGFGDHGVRGDGNNVGVMGVSTSGIGVVGEGGVGVEGTGALRGGVFQVSTTKEGTEFANLQLTPVETKASKLQPSSYKPNPTVPDLPKNGKAGDLLVVDVQDLGGVQLWFCINGPNKTQNATWARIQFENEITVP